MHLRRALVGVGMAAAATLALARCGNDGFNPDWKVISFRVLGIVVEPPDALPGDTIQLTAVLADKAGVNRVNTVTWAVCPHVDINSDTGTHTCSAGNLQVLSGVQTSFVAPAPNGQNPYEILGYACAGGTIGLDATMQPTCTGGDGFEFLRTVPVRVPPGIHNPGIAHVLLDGVELVDGTPGTAPLCVGDPSACRAIPIKVEFASDARELEPQIQANGTTVMVLESLVSEFLVDGGTLDSAFRSDGDANIAPGPNPPHTNTFVPPSTAGLVRLWVLVQNGLGGFSYVLRTIQVGMGSGADAGNDSDATTGMDIGTGS